MKESQNRPSGFESRVKQSLYNYISDTIRKLPQSEYPLHQNPFFSFMDETDDIPVTFGSVISAKFWTSESFHSLDMSKCYMKPQIGITIRQKPRDVDGSIEIPITEVGFEDPPEFEEEATGTRFEGPGERLIREMQGDQGGDYELIIQVIGALHKQYPTTFPAFDIS